jgi:ADP-heptose:LPS heptosyltransferase
MSACPLVIFHKQLGDVLLLEPALAKLVSATNADVVLATRPAFSPMLSLMDRVRPLEPGVFRRADRVISFDYRLRACQQALTTLAPDKCLIVPAEKHLRGWHRFIFPTECKSVDASTLYRAEYFYNVMPVTASMAFRPPRLRVPPVGWLPPGLPSGYVLIHPTSAWKRKSWPAENWGKAITALHGMGLGPFVVTGGDSEWERAYVADLKQATSVPVVDLCGKTGVTGYMATVAHARMVLCIDGSAAHLAAAFTCPSVALFGPTHPLHWHYPAEQSCLIDARRFVSEERPAVAIIPVDAVIEDVSRLWKAIA